MDQEEEVAQENELHKNVMIPYLHTEVMSKIFTRIPADILVEKFKKQCKEWLNTISNQDFVDAHGCLSEHGILQVIPSDGITVFKFIGVKGLEEVNDDEAPRRLAVFPKTLSNFCSCNGLVLCQDCNSNMLYITNPATKEVLSLPPPCNHHHTSSTQFLYELVYVPSIMKYKVVELCNDSHSWRFHIQTIGGFASCYSWRTTAVEEPSLVSLLAFGDNQVSSVNGFLYVYKHGGFSPIMCFDVGDETTLRRLPSSPSSAKFILAEMGGFLSLISGRAVYTSVCDYVAFGVWILKDDDKGGVWEKTLVIDRGPTDIPQLSFFRFLPRKSLDNGEVIIFQGESTYGSPVKYFVYDVKTRQWKAMGKFRQQNEYILWHSNTLVSLKHLK